MNRSYSSVWKLLRNTTLVYGILFLASAIFISKAYCAELQLATSGKSDYKIVLPAEASPVQRSAANELQSYFKQVADAELPITSEVDVSWSPSEKFFVIGPGNL
ncbi:MAG: hypothetical protein J6X44_05625, partial [Thermoguttaceae bacterium]|nr:hypothetical protein [Thermoguttaceae bacterium]